MSEAAAKVSALRWASTSTRSATAQRKDVAGSSARIAPGHQRRSTASMFESQQRQKCRRTSSAEEEKKGPVDGSKGSIIRKARSEGVQRGNASTRWRWISTIMLPVGEQWGGRRGRSGQKGTFGKVRLSVADKGTHKNGTPKSARGFFPKSEAACNYGRARPFVF